MVRLPRATSKRVLKALLREGFYIHHQTGSHVNLRHPNKPHLHVVIPLHAGDLAPRTIKSILAQAELTAEDLTELK